MPQEERELEVTPILSGIGCTPGTGMEKDILSAIVQVEKEIRERLTLEQQKAEERLAKALQDCAEEIAREETRLKEDLAAAGTTATFGDARKRADNLVAEATARAERLATLDDESLKQLIRGELFRIVPGKKT